MSPIDYRRGVLTLDEYSDSIIGGDTGRWRAAVRRAADVAGPGWQPVLAPDPAQAFPLQAAALLVYAISAGEDIEPSAVTEEMMAAWFERQFDPQFGLELSLRAAGHEVPLGDGWLPPVLNDPVTETWRQLIVRDEPPPIEFDSAMFYPGPNLGQALWRVASMTGAAGASRV
ncbi:hypothetical protein [Micromonospora aurantiaca (nom. illeg.)]|uniref:hypothetical protein n=1 Tax=Micromonospora aurantiaca (nom. illeg.) TaxID=47850 RepID=UPI0033FC34D1